MVHKSGRHAIHESLPGTTSGKRPYCMVRSAKRLVGATNRDAGCDEKAPAWPPDPYLTWADMRSRNVPTVLSHWSALKVPIVHSDGEKNCCSWKRKGFRPCNSHKCPFKTRPWDIWQNPGSKAMRMLCSCFPESAESKKISSPPRPTTKSFILYYHRRAFHFPRTLFP